MGCLFRLGTLLTLIALTVSAYPQEAKTHFAFVGPLQSFLAPDRKPAAVTEGLGFAITLTEGGKTVQGDSFELKIAGVGRSLKLMLEGLKYEGGHLTGQAKIANDTGAAVEGVRLDIVGATETYRAKDDQGKEILKTRSQKVSLPSPLHFGDIKEGEDNGALALNAGEIAFAPETAEIKVQGVVSGRRFSGQFAVPEITKYQMDVDAQGHLYLSGGDVIKRADADGKSIIAFVKEEHNGAVLVDRSNGDVLTVSKNNTLIRYDSNGREKQRWDAEKRGLEWLTLGLRMDKKGLLYNCGDNQRCIQCIGPDGKKRWKVELPLDQGSLFDVDAAGRVYATAGDQTVMLYEDEGKKATRFAGGNDWHLGSVINPVSVRLHPRSDVVYIVESGRTEDEDKKLTAEYARISEFTASGAFIRTWGRGGKTVPGEPAHPAGLYRPVDLAIGPDGRIYVLCERPGENDSYVMIFQPF